MDIILKAIFFFGGFVLVKWIIDLVEYNRKNTFTRASVETVGRYKNWTPRQIEEQIVHLRNTGNRQRD
jgi:succinate-acetate transporter protein